MTSVYKLDSVLKYDQAYRRVQAPVDFRWASDTPYVDKMHLRFREDNPYKIYLRENAGILRGSCGDVVRHAGILRVLCGNSHGLCRNLRGSVSKPKFCVGFLREMCRQVSTYNHSMITVHFNSNLTNT